MVAASEPLRCVVRWMQVVDQVENRVRIVNSHTLETRCVIRTIRELYVELRKCGRSGGIPNFATTKPFWHWMFNLSGISLRAGEMEDPLDMLRFLWPKMCIVTGSLEYCGENCVQKDVHIAMMAVTLCAKLQ